MSIELRERPVGDLPDADRDRISMVAKLTVGPRDLLVISWQGPRPMSVANMAMATNLAEKAGVAQDRVLHAAEGVDLSRLPEEQGRRLYEQLKRVYG